MTSEHASRLLFPTVSCRSHMAETIRNQRIAPDLPTSHWLSTMHSPTRSHGVGDGEKRTIRPRPTHSCALCRARRIKCDRQKPSCSNCTKSQVSCVPADNSHLPPRKTASQNTLRSKRSDDINTKSRLDRLEEVLQRLTKEVEHQTPAKENTTQSPNGNGHDVGNTMEHDASPTYHHAMQQLQKKPIGSSRDTSSYTPQGHSLLSATEASGVRTQSSGHDVVDPLGENLKGMVVSGPWPGYLSPASWAAVFEEVCYARCCR